MTRAMKGRFVNSLQSILEPSIQDLVETVNDFRNASFQDSENVLARFLCSTDEEPLAGFLASALPAVDFSAWWSTAESSSLSMAGSGRFDWPIERGARVAMQLALIREIAAQRIRFLDFLHRFYYTHRSSIPALVDSFATGLLAPFVRDVVRLAEARPVPPVLFEAMGRLPTSGDATLDALLHDACQAFRDPAPTARQRATKKLWDAWERLKTLDDADKKRGMATHLARAAPGVPFRERLEAEAKALTDIGNDFHVRHFETSRTPLDHPAHFDYLFHRLYALIHLLLFTRNNAGDGRGAA